MKEEQKGRYVNFLPENLREIYERGIEDPQLLHLRHEIGIVDLHLKILLETIDANVLTVEEIDEELLDRFPNMDVAERVRLAEYIRSMQPEHFIDNRTFRRLEQKVEQYQVAVERREIRKADATLRELFRTIREGKRAGDIWNDIEEALDRRKTLVGAEQSRLTQQAQLLTVEKVVLLLELTIEALRVSVNKYVKDEEIRDYILVEAERQYTELLGDRNDQAAYQIQMD